MPIKDDFLAGSSSILAPFSDAKPISPSDGTDLDEMTRGLMVGSAGDVSVITRDGTTVTIPGLEPGAIYPIRVSRVRATGTTATGIVGLY